MRDKREVIFDMPDTYGKYRMVCRFGYHDIVDYAWWGFLQKEITTNGFLWVKPKNKWVDVDQCWWCIDINSIEQLKSKATEFYHETVELVPIMKQKAMNI